MWVAGYQMPESLYYHRGHTWARPLDADTVVIGLDGATGRGSARTVGRFNVLEAMSGARAHLDRFGGHEQAAGLEIRAENVERARAAIVARARAMLAGAGHVDEGLAIDCELPFEQVTGERMKELTRLGPFGVHNAEPVFLSREVYLAEAPRVVGAEQNHVMLRMRKGNHVLKGMAFRAAARIDELTLGKPIDAVFTPRWNTFRGETSLERGLEGMTRGTLAYAKRQRTWFRRQAPVTWLDPGTAEAELLAAAGRAS